MSASTPAQPTVQLTEANHYELRNGSLSLTYTATDLVGKPHLTVHDGKRSKTYTGDQIRQEETALGLLLSVADISVDVVSHRLTLALPKVLVAAGQPQKVSTFAVLVGPDGPVVHPQHVGQEETYTVKSLHGTADVIFT